MAYKVEHRVGIAAPVETVYEILKDIEAWPQWSPIHRATQGKLGYDAPIRLEEHYEGLGGWEVSGTVADYAPLSHIHIAVPKPFYAGSLTRFFELDKLTDTACTFSVGAYFSGFLSEREGRRYGPKIKTGFTAMAEALKAKAEAAFTADPTPSPPETPTEPPRKPLVKRTDPKVKPIKMFGHR
jgi:uncharacterized protein YndB with AHSA1/START domain